MANRFNLPTVTDLLRRTTAVLSTRHHFLTLLILSYLLFWLRYLIEKQAHSVTTHIDNDPFIQTHLSPTHLPPKPTTPVSSTRHHHPAGILENDEFDPRFDNIQYPGLNKTSFILDSMKHYLGFFNFVSNSKNLEKEDNITVLEVQDEVKKVLGVIGGLVTSFVYMISIYVAVHVAVHGVIFVLVVRGFLNIRSSYYATLGRGMFLGGERLFRIMLLRWAYREAMTLVLGLFFFADEYAFFKIFTRLNFLSFSVEPPWIEGYEMKKNVFMFLWLFCDIYLSYCFSLCAWVAMEDPGRNMTEVIAEGCRLLALRTPPAVNLKTIEVIVCGPFARILLTHIFGRVYGSMILSFMEVYFLVAWALHYFSVKSVDAASKGIRFRNTELVAMLQHA